MGNLRKELTEKVLLDMMAKLNSQAALMQAERDFERAESSCKENFLN